MKRLWMGLLIALLLCVGVAALAEDTPAAPTISLAELTAGKDSPFSLARGDEEASWACAKLYAVAGEEETLVFAREDYIGSSGVTMSLPGYLVQPGNYVLRAWTSRSTYTQTPGSLIAEQTFEISEGNQLSAPTLVLDKTEALTGETITARFLDLPETGGQEELYVSLLCRESGSDASWETARETDWRPGMEAPSVTCQASFGSVTGVSEYPATRNYEYMAVACDRNLCYSRLSAVATVSVTALGALDAPAIVLPDAFLPGHDFEAAFVAENAESYRIRLEIRNAEYGYWDTVESQTSAATTATVSGQQLNGGAHARLRVTASATGYADSTASVEFDVQAGDRLAAPEVSAASESFYSTAPSRFRLSGADGADRVACEVYMAGQEDHPWQSDTVQANADGTFEINVGRMGSYTLRACACINGAWTEWSQPLAFTVGEAPRLPSPEVTVAQPVPVGSVLEVAVTPAEGAYYHNVTLVRQEGGQWNRVASGSVPPNGTTCTLASVDGLDAGHYRVEVTAYPKNDNEYRSSEATLVEFDVTGQRPAAPALSLPEGEKYIRQTVQIGVEGAYSLAACRYRLDGGAWSQTGTSSLYDGEYDWSADAPGPYELCLRGQTEGRWSEWSEPVAFELLSLGTLEVPTFSELPDSVPAESDFTVAVNPVPNADYYLYTLRPVSGPYRSGEDVRGGRRVTLTGVDFDYATPGDYTLTCTAYTARSYQLASASATITVVEAEKAVGPAVTLDAARYAVGDTAIATVSVPGAQGLRIKLGSNTVNRSEASDSYCVPLTLDKAGEAALSASVKLAGAWTDYGPETTLVVESQGALAAPVIALDEGYRGVEGETLRFHVDVDGNAESCSVNVSRSIQQGGYMVVGAAQPVAGSPGDYVLDGLNLLEGSYRISAESVAYGREAAAGTLNFTILAADPATRPQVTLREATGEASATFVVSAPGASRVRMRADFDTDPSDLRFYGGYGESGSSDELPILATQAVWRVTNGEAEIDCPIRGNTLYYRFSAQVNGEWGAWSAPIAVEGSSSGDAPSPDLPEPELTLSATAVRAGDALTLQVAPMAQAARGWLSVAQLPRNRMTPPAPPSSGSGSLPDVEDLSQGATLSVDTSALAAGVYQLTLSASASGWSGSSATVYFEVTEGPDEAANRPTLTVEADRTEAAVGQAVRFTLTASGAITQISQLSSSKVGFDGNSYGVPADSYSAPGFAGTDVPDNVYSTSETYDRQGRFAAIFRVQVEGVWSAYSEPIFITVRGEGETEQVFPPLDFSLSETAVEAGQPITARWQALEGAQSYRVRVYASKRVLSSLGGSTEDLSYEIDTAGLPEGGYAVSVTPVGAGYTAGSGADELIGFRVLAPTDGSALILPASLKRVEEEAFAGAPAARIVVPDGCVAIDARAFANCLRLRRVVLPASVTQIADDAFEGCSGVVVQTPAGSTAEAFARTHGMSVVHG